METLTTRITKATAVGAAVLALAGVGYKNAPNLMAEGLGLYNAGQAALEESEPLTTDHTYTQAELAHFKPRQVTVQPGEGADAVILNVPANHKAGLFSSDTDDLVAVRQYIDDQHPGALQPGEQVEVPVLPAEGK